MRIPTLPLTILGSLTLAACASTVAATDGGSASQNAAAPAAANGAPAAKAAAAGGALEKVGIVAPAGYAAVVLWPEQHSGAFTLLEVLPHGSAVQAGDAIAKCDTRAIDEELHRMELEMRSTEIRHQAVVEKNKLDAAAAELAQEQSKSSLERAKRSFDGYKRFETDFEKRQDELSKRWEQARIDDATDELDQLVKMYNADALVDATEDIVRKRAVRDLENTRFGVELSGDRRKYHDDFDEKMTLEQREEALRSQTASHERLVKQQELDARSRADAELRSADGLREQKEKLERLQRDRELFEIRAPRAGVLLHGGSKDFRPGKNPPRYERASSLPTRAEVFLVAEPEAGAVNFEINDAELAKAPDGARVAVESLAVPSEKTRGRLSVETYPRSANAGDATYDARATLDAPLSGVVYGTRAKVIVQPASGDAKVDG